MREFFKEYLKDIMHDPEMQKWFKDYLKELLNDPQFLKDLKDKLGITEIENNLNKIIDNLKRSGAWENGNLKPDRNIATGNINIFGGTTDGGHFIRTNNGATEDDLAGGV